MSSKNGLEFLEEIANAFKPPQNGNTVHVMRGGKKFTFKRPGPEFIRLKGEKRAKPNTYKNPTASELNGMWEESGGMNSRKVAIKSHRTGPWSAEHSFLANTKNSINDNLNKFKRSEFKKTKREKMQAKKDKAESKKQKKIKQAIKSKKDHQTKKKAANASSSPTAEKKKKKKKTPPTKKKSFQQKSPKKLTPASAVTTRSSNKKKK